MTIYAIVNNLLQSCDNSDLSPVWTIISPSAIIQGGNPYFVPDFANRFSAVPGLAIKIGKLGKTVAPRFAHRYADSAAPCCMMPASDLLEYLRGRSLPWTRAVSYDRSLVMGQFAECTFENISQYEVALSISDTEDIQRIYLHGSGLSHSIEETICAISRDNTLKTGDIIIAGISPQLSLPLRPGLRASLSLNSCSPLKFNIR